MDWVGIMFFIMQGFSHRVGKWETIKGTSFSGDYAQHVLYISITLLFVAYMHVLLCLYN